MNTIQLDSQPIAPSKIVCIGRNYLEHIRELGNETPDAMVIFNKPNSAISQTLFALRDEPLHYEGEICFMVKQGELDALGFGLDLTKRELQSKLKSKGLPWERAKAFDAAAGVGSKCAMFAQERGLIVRALGETVAFCPPLIITNDEVNEVFDCFQGALDDTLEWVNKEGL